MTPYRKTIVASVGHVAVGLCAGRLAGGGWRRMMAWSALSLLPDVDAIGFVLGVPYEAPFGHRGATHSVVFAILCGVVIAAVARERRVWMGVMAMGVGATHPLLDALTNGGLGVALWWPFSVERFFAPWRPLPVAPIGVGLVSWRGARVMLIELAAFAPLLLWGMWPGRRARGRT